MDDQSPEFPTSVDIFQIARNIQDGTADPEDARRLMSLFCYFVDNDLKRIKQPKELFGYQPDEQIPKELLWHFSDAFKAILDEGKTPLRALGLTRKKARPKANHKIRVDMAHEILLLRLAGLSHQDALQQAADEYGWGVTIIGEAWKQNKFEAMLKERFERPDNHPWTDEEENKLCEIFKK